VIELLDIGSELGLITVAVFGGAMLLLVVLLLALLGQGSTQARKTSRRVDALRRRGNGGIGPTAAAASSIKIEESSSRIPGMDELARRLVPRRAILADRLERTGRTVSLGSYAVFCVATGVICGLVMNLLFAFPPAIAVLGAIAAGVGLPHIFVGFMIARRTRAFMAQFPEAIELIVRGIKSGLPVTEEIAVVGKEMSDPVGIEFRKISDALRFGQTLETALWETAGRLGIPEFNFFVISLSVQRETGGNLAETLENLAEILRRRRVMKLKIRAMSSEARASAYIIGSLPFLMLGILFLVAPAYIIQLFTDTRGNVMLGGAVMLQALGVFIMFKMVRFDI
jgi:tight adherence protein B